jgi:hypothetical protein
VSEDKPFNEYWALMAPRKVHRGHCEALDDATRNLLLLAGSANLSPNPAQCALRKVEETSRDLPDMPVARRPSPPPVTGR